MYTADKTKSTPIIFINISDTPENTRTFLTKEVKTPARTIISPCPKENIKSISAAYTRLALKDAKLIMPTKIGVEQGVAASANNAPRIKG